MNKNINVTIAGKNIDDWIDTGPESTRESDVIDKFYNKKVVAFLDLLAMKDLIKQNNNKPGDEKEALDTIYKISTIVARVTKLLARSEDFYLLNISDSFIFTCSESDILTLIKVLATIQMRILIECKFQLRGAVTYGDVYVDDEGKQIIGPAYIEAYLLQENNAIYPRIIIGNPLLSKLNEIEASSENITSSEDGDKYIDSLSIFMESGKIKRDDAILYFKKENVYNYLTEQYTKYDKLDNYTVKQKYGWTIQYFKSKGVWANDK